MKATLSALFGSFMGYLVWILNSTVELSPGVISIVVNERVFTLLSALSGNRNVAESIMLVVLGLLRALPVGVLLGGAVGMSLPRVLHKRLICYSVLAWPAFLFCSSLAISYVLQKTTGSLSYAIWQGHSELAQKIFAIYSVFYVGVVVAFSASRRASLQNKTAAIP